MRHVLLSPRHKYVTAILLHLLLITIIFSAGVQVAHAVTPVKMTTYRVLNNGNTTYCATETGIYKVTLKNKKVKQVKRLYVYRSDYGAFYSCCRNLRRKGNYLYFTHITNTALWTEKLARLNLKTGKVSNIYTYGKSPLKKADTGEINGYAIKGSKLYVDIRIYDNNDYSRTFVSKLNGKSARLSKVKVKNTEKISNSKGYKIIEKDNSEYIMTYLKTPKGTYYLGKAKTF